MTSALTRSIRGVVAMLCVLAASTVTEAGIAGVSCARPQVFPDAAVNVVVLPYTAPAGLTPSNDAGRRLSVLLQLESLRAIAKFGSVGTVQLEGLPEDCDPDVVLAKLLGQRPGAAVTLKPRQGVILVWGRIYEQAGTVYIQTFCRFERRGLKEQFELRSSKYVLVGQVSAQAFACAPRRITLPDLSRIEQQFVRSTTLYREPNASGPGTSMPPEPIPYYVAEQRGQWMRIEGRGLGGWLRLSAADDEWSITRWLPELKLVEGLAGYVRYRVAREGTPSEAPAGTLTDATRAFEAYEESLAAGWAERAAHRVGVGPKWRESLANAVQLQLRGMLRIAKPEPSTEDVVAAGALFERASTLVGVDSHASNLASITQLVLAYNQSATGASARKSTADLLTALGADPTNRLVMDNLAVGYELLLAGEPRAGEPPLSAEERRQFEGQLSAIRKLKGAP